MGTETTSLVVHPEGEQPEVEAWAAVADTYAGRVHVEWDATAPVTPFGQLPFFIEYLKQGGLFDGWVADCPLVAQQPECPAQARSAWHRAAVGSGGSPALRPHHGAALRSGEPAAAWHAQSGERGRGAPQPRQDRRSAGADLAARPS